MKTNKLIITLLLILICNGLSSQTVVVSDVAGYNTGDASSMLDIHSLTKGLLIPRVTLTSVLTSASPVTSPETGLIVYNVGANQPVGIYFWSGSAWTPIAGSGSADGSETKINGGNSISVSGTGTSGTPYVLGFAPRSVTYVQRGSLTPTTSMMVFCTDCGPTGELQVYNGTIWTNITGGTALTNALSIGDSYGGGIVAYILQSGDPGYNASVQHGLIAAPSNQGSFVEWGCSGTSISTGTAIGTGLQNSINIDAGCATVGIAAELCLDLVLNGYSDWYLPGKDELNKLYINRVAIGGFDTHQYWSSSQSNISNAWIQVFDSGGSQFGGLKGATIRVRAIRAF